MIMCEEWKYVMPINVSNVQRRRMCELMSVSRVRHHPFMSIMSANMFQLTH